MKTSILLMIYCIGNVYGDCFLPKIPQSVKIRTTKLSHGDIYPDGAIIIVSCARGYHRIGERVNRCMQDHWLKNWTVDCLSNYQCLEPVDPPGSARVGHCCHTGRSVLTYSCAPGLALVGPSSIKCILTRKTKAVWSSKPPTCKVQTTCEAPMTIEDGYMRFNKTLPDYSTFIPGDTVKYLCNRGYILEVDLFSERSEMTCLKDGTWNLDAMELPYCEELICYPSRVDNATIDPANQTEFLEGGVIEYTCDEGLFLTGSKRRMCNSDFFGFDGVKPSCEERKCVTPGSPDNGRATFNSTMVGATVEFQCSDGYQLYGSQSRTCTEFFQWNGTLTTCDKGDTDCANPGIPMGGSKVGNRYNVGDRVTFRCDSGMTMIGPKTTECLPIRRWSGYSKTRCIQKYSFDDPSYAADKVQNVFDSLALETISSNASMEMNIPKKRGKGRSLNLNYKFGLDLVIVFDASGSVTKDVFELEKEFAIALVNKVTVSPINAPGGTRVGLLLYHSEAEIRVQLSEPDIKHKDDIIREINKMEHKGGGTATAEALRKVVDEMLPIADRENRERAKAKKAVVLITDGNYNMYGNPEAHASRLHKLHVEMFCVGIGANINTINLIKLATDEKHFIHLLHTKDFEKVLNKMLDEKDYSSCGMGQGKYYGDGYNSSEIENAKESAWPWMVSIFYNKNNAKRKDEFIAACGGSIIAPEWILTAAHCLHHHRKEYDLRAGSNNPMGGNIYSSLEASRFILHENYTKETEDLFYDIALIRLKSPITYNPKLRPICLPDLHDENFRDIDKEGDKYGIVTGWGNTADLQQIVVPIQTPEYCNNTLAGFSQEVSFCAGDEDKKIDSRGGDSGGPFMWRVTNKETRQETFHQVGIVSWGVSKKSLGVYTRIPGDLRKWIKDKTGL